jgi:prepilin-type N-terminal cleavage/methylation domain-containing protein
MISSDPSAKANGFTLIELAIVLFIVALLLGGMLVPFSAQQEIHGRQETDRALATIREALLGFALINGRLPCPAIAATATGTNDSEGKAAGTEAIKAGTSGNCICTTTASGIASVGNNQCNPTSAAGYVSGVLPWATLGLPETDAWGNRYTYTMLAMYGRTASGQTAFGTDTSGNPCLPTSNPTSAAFALCSAQASSSISLSVKTSATGTVIASAVPAIVLSHGRNTLGAYLPTGNKISGASGDELENADGNSVFVSSTAIDDQVIWIPLSTLMSKMIAAGKLP